MLVTAPVATQKPSQGMKTGPLVLPLEKIATGDMQQNNIFLDMTRSLRGEADQDDDDKSTTDDAVSLGSVGSPSNMPRSSSNDAEPAQVPAAGDLPVPAKWLPDDCPTVGTLGHSSGNCKPCFFTKTRVGCQYGRACLYCHGEHVRQKQARPTKQVRDECKEQARALVDSLRLGAPDARALLGAWHKRQSAASPRSCKYMSKVMGEVARELSQADDVLGLVNTPAPPLSPQRLPPGLGLDLALGLGPGALGGAVPPCPAQPPSLLMSTAPCRQPGSSIPLVGGQPGPLAAAVTSMPRPPPGLHPRPLDRLASAAWPPAGPFDRMTAGPVPMIDLHGAVPWHSGRSSVSTPLGYRLSC